MKDILARIDTLTDMELQTVMRAIERRYFVAYPQWEVIYVAIHRDMPQREQGLRDLVRLMDRDIQWFRGTELDERSPFAPFTKNCQRFPYNSPIDAQSVSWYHLSIPVESAYSTK